MILKRTISKEEVKEMPKAAFPGRIHVIQTESEAEKAVAYLQSQAILGIDSETRPSFTKGHSHKVALLQISSDECCFLFRLNMTGLTQPIIELLENPEVIKVGLSLKDDFMMLHKRAPFNRRHASSCKSMSVRSAFRIKACKRYTASYSGKKSQNHNVFPIGKQMY